MTQRQANPRRVVAAEELAVLFALDRDVHVYGLADLDEPLWSSSTWWRDGDAALGVLDLGGGTGAFYAVSPAAPAATLELLGVLADRLPHGSEGTGPVGLAEVLARHRPITPLGVHHKLAVAPGELVAAPAPGGVTLRRLTRSDLAALRTLHAAAGDPVFFLPAMLGDGVHVGAWTDGRLVAAAGTHVHSTVHRVAAIGAVVTHPDQRGRGLGAAVTRAVAAPLLEAGTTVGLNVRADNVAALRLYTRLGFAVVHTYEEARVVDTRVADARGA